MVYKNIVNALKNIINNHHYNIGDLLPSEQELAERYSVSRNTLRKALKQLEQEEMIERRHGSGTYVKNKTLQAHVTHMSSFSEIARNNGKQASSQILKFELQVAPPAIATNLHLLADAPVYYIKRLRLMDNIPVQLEETWLSAERFPNLTVAHMKNSKFSYIENECGIKIIGCCESFTPILPDAELAQILRLSTRDPILKMQTQAIDENNYPLDYSILHSNMFELQVKYFLSR